MKRITSDQAQNITLALPTELLKRVKIIAAKRDTSVSQLVRDAMEDLADRESDYQRARRRHQKWLKGDSDLGTGGRATWTRDELQER